MDHPPKPFVRVQSRGARDAIFRGHKSLIERLYVVEEQPLKDIMKYMKRTFGLDQSLKQYKSQLKAWGFRHKLTKRDAAFVLRLLNKARAEGRSEVVLFSDHPRRREDIERYIQRSTGIIDDADLLSAISDGDKTPQYIREEGAKPEPYQHSTPSQLPPTPPSANTFTSFDTPASGSDVPPMREPIPSPESSPRHSGEWPDNAAQLTRWVDSKQRGLPGPMEVDTDRMTMQMTIAGTQPAVPNIVGPFWRSQRDHTPSEWWHLWDNSDPSKQWPADFTNAALSVTPAVVDQLDDLDFNIYRFGNHNHSRQLKDGSYSALFVMNCIFWLICVGQNDNKFRVKASYYLNSALFTFLCMLPKGPGGEECLGALSLVAVLFDCYGQWQRLAELLTKCDEVARNHLGGDNPLTMTIEFKKNMLQSGDGKCPPHDIARLRYIYGQMKADFPESPGPALMARYNLAWAMFENELKKAVKAPKDFVPARLELLQLLEQCEHHFGDERIETIMAAATLARATFYCGDAEEAENIIVNSVLPRIRKNFPESHPYTWEAKHRHAFFLFQLAKKEQDPRRSVHLQLGEQLLREVVRSRRRILGPSNPKSGHSFYLLQDILKVQGRMYEADTLSDWCERELSEHGAG